MSGQAGAGPCAGLSVVELAAGSSELGLGLAGGVPGMLFAGLGATVTRVTGVHTPPIDDPLPWGRVWHRGKSRVATDDQEETRRLVAAADVVLAYGSEDAVDGRGFGFSEVAALNPAVVYIRCGPSRTSRGEVEDYGLLVEARAGLCTQLDGHRPGPIFLDVRATGSGASFLMMTSALALLRRRVLTGAGGWAHTSLYDGMLATLGCMIGRSERAPVEVESYWEKGSTFPNFMYRCSDGELVQVWFGGKGMYATLLEVLGDEPSPQGYYQDQATGALNDRAVRWRETFRQQPRATWIERLRTAGIACEPVLSPGQALSEPHLGEIGLVETVTADSHTDLVLATPISVEDLPGLGDDRLPAPAASTGEPLLHGVRVVDFSAFVAGPLAAQVLADLGAEVIKVEPPQGEAMRAAAYAVAACQRGKRSLAMDIGAPECRPVVERLIAGADVVLHNFRVGVAERLGIDSATVARLRPAAVYCHATGFGAGGPRAKLPGNDALMQALTGFEQGIGGDGNDPIAGTWIPLDMTGGWVAAIGILAGLYARAATGRGQQVTTSLLGAGMLMHSGVFQRDGAVVRGPELDRAQTGYGPGYRLYAGGDGRWLALVVPDPTSWAELGKVAGLSALPPAYRPLRVSPDDETAVAAERFLEAAFATAPAAEWVARLGDRGLLAELIEPCDRDQFRRGILDDPVNQELGRVAAYETRDWGHFEQIGPLLRCGPHASGGPMLELPGIGEHSVEVLTELGFASQEIDALIAAGHVRQTVS